MPMNCCAKHEMLGKYCSCFAHRIKGLKAFANIVEFWKNDNSILRNLDVSFLVETKAPNTHV
jgi:hypothetical protein